MRRISPAVLGVLALLPFGALSSSCNRQSSTTLEQAQVIDDQITGFSLLTDEASLQAALARTAFTIRHSAPGVITNPQALPYSASPYTVRLNIQRASSSTLVDVLTRDGQTIRWESSTQTFSSAQLFPSVQLRVRTMNPETGAEVASYTYQVTFKRYAADPHTFAWSTASATGLPAFSSVIGVDPGEGASQTLYYIKPDGTNAASAFQEPTGTWSEVPIAGIPAGERLTSLLRHEGTLYVTTSADRLYRRVGDSFSPVALPADSPAPQSLLGGQAGSIALVARSAQGYQVFARYEPATGGLTARDHRPQATFPITGGVAYGTSSVVYQGASLYLAGGRTASGEVASSLWSTTNGTDWLLVGSASTPQSGVLHQAIAHTADARHLYRFATTASGLSFSLSQDAGRSWEEARSTGLVGLTPSDFAGYPVYAFASASGTTVYLLRGARTAGQASQLYVGQFGGLQTTTN